MSFEQNPSKLPLSEKPLVVELLLSFLKDALGLDTLNELFDVDDFHLRIFQLFLGFLFLNFVLIWVAWKVYGSRIIDRFMKQVPNEVLEDLKAGATELKLPREHSPRI